MILKLEYPIEVAGAKIAQLDLQRLTGADLARSESAIAGDDIAARMASGGGLIPAVQMVQLISASARVPPSTVGALDAADYSAAAEVVHGFLSRGKAPAGAPASSV